MKYILSFSLLMTFILCSAQSVTIDGEAKITQMSTDNSIDDIVVRGSDGTLNTRSAQSLPGSNDTTRTLASDLELAKFMCECGSDFPPYLIDNLLDAGYTNQDLIEAGVPVNKILDAIPVVDADGNTYEYITINGTKWMTSNLRTTKFNDNEDIPLVISDADWKDIDNTNPSPAYCYYNNSSANAAIYGALYNWGVIDSTLNGGHNICPVGWDIPTEQDFEELISALDPSGTSANNVAGIYARSSGTTYWSNQFYTGIDAVGLDMRGSGLRTNTGFFGNLKFGIYLWTKDQNGGTSLSKDGRIDFNDPTLKVSAQGRSIGLSVRCIQK